jgi:hypothetical protein
MNKARRVLKAELQKPQLRSGGQPSPPGDQEVILGGGEGQDLEMGRHPLAQVDGAGDDGPQRLQALVPSKGNPRFRILKDTDSRRVILMERKRKNDTGPWEYFIDPERAFNTCCLMVTGGEERLQHFCTDHKTFLECMGKLLADSEFYVCDYCNKGTGLWEKYHRFSFLDHKFLYCDGRMRAIEDALLSVTVEGF